MKRIFWWTVFGISGAGLPALWLGQSVTGQPGSRPPLPILTSQPIVPAAKGGGAKPTTATPQSLDLPTGQLQDLKSTPVVPPPRPGEPTPLSNVSPIASPNVLPVAQPVAPLAPSSLPPPPVTSRLAPVAPLPSSTKSDGTPEGQPGKQQSSVSIEWVAPASIRIHQPMPCQILVKNTSGVAVHNVIVRHRVGQGVTCKSSEPRVTQEDGELTWALGTLAPEQMRRIDLVLVSQTRGTLNCQATASFTAVAGHQVQVREPMLAIKMRAPDKAIAGETFDLVVTVSNPGDGVTEAIKVKTLLPEGLEHEGGRRTIEFNVGNLMPKETKALQLPCIAKGSGTQKCMIVATGDGNLNSTDSVQFDILVPKLDIALAGPKLRYLDRRAVYVLKVTNPGSAPATNVEVQELIPSGFKFQQANHGGKFQEATRLVTWNLGDLQPGENKEISVDLVPIETGDHRLSAFAKSARGLKSESEIRTVVEGLPSLFIEVGHVDDPIEVGAETTYEIRVANTGTKTETNVEVICTLPEQLEFKGAKCTSTLRFRQEGRDLIFEPLPKLAPKADVIYRVQVRGIAPGDIRFRTKIRADGLAEPLVREENTRVYRDDGPLRPAPARSAPGALPQISPSFPGVSTKPMDESPRTSQESTPAPATIVPTRAPAPSQVFPPFSGPAPKINP